MAYNIIQDLKILGELQLAQATPAQIAAFAELANFLSDDNRPAIKRNGVTEESAFLSDLTEFLTAAQINTAISNAVAAVEGAVRYAGHYSPVATTAMPLAADNIIDGELSPGDMFVITANGTIDTSDVEYFGNQDVTGGTLDVTKGDQLIYMGLAGDGSAKWSHADDPFFDTLATASDYGIVKLLDAATVGDAMTTANQNSTVTYEGMLAMQSLIEAGYTEAIAQAETAAAVQRYVVSTTYPQTLVTQLATLSNGIIDVTAPTLPADPTPAQRNQYLVDLANTTFTAFTQLETVIGDIVTDVNDRLKISDARERVNAKIVGAPVGSGTDNVSVYSVSLDAAEGIIALDGYTGSTQLSSPTTDEVYALEDAAGNFVAYGRVSSAGTSQRFVSATDTPFDADIAAAFVGGARIRTLELVTAIEESFTVANIDKHLRQNLDGNETNAAPSVAAVQQAIQDANEVNGNFVKYISPTTQYISGGMQIGANLIPGISLGQSAITNVTYEVQPGQYPFLPSTLVVTLTNAPEEFQEGTPAYIFTSDELDADGNFVNTRSVEGEILTRDANGTVTFEAIDHYGNFLSFYDAEIASGSTTAPALFYNEWSHGSVDDLHVTRKITSDALPQILTGNQTKESPSVAAVKLVTDAMQTQIDDLAISAGGAENLWTVTDTDAAWVEDAGMFVYTFAAPVIAESAGNRQHSHGSVEMEIDGQEAVLTKEWADSSTRLTFDVRLPFKPTELKVYSSLVPGAIVG